MAGARSTSSPPSITPPSGATEERRRLQVVVNQPVEPRVVISEMRRHERQRQGDLARSEVTGDALGALEHRLFEVGPSR
jgi:hypothetical protein